MFSRPGGESDPALLSVARKVTRGQEMHPEREIVVVMVGGIGTRLNRRRGEQHDPGATPRPRGYPFGLISDSNVAPAPASSPGRRWGTSGTPRVGLVSHLVRRDRREDAGGATGKPAP